MAKRILLIVRPDRQADVAGAARAVASTARDSGGIARIAYVAPLPPPRLDRHDRLVADTDREMARISREARERFGRLTAELDPVPVETVVRFGRLTTEVRIEAEVFGADLVVLAAPPWPTLIHELLARYLERVALGGRVPLVLLPRPRHEEDAATDALFLAPLH